MSDKEDDSFLKSLKGVKPLKKTNKITKPVPKKTILKKNIDFLSKKEPDYFVVEKNENKKNFSKNLKIEKNQLNKKLKKGKIKINKKIDFHGRSLEDAKILFLETIENCFFNNERCILFVTGKGTTKIPKDENQEKKLYYGKIRNEFLSWILLKETQSKILNVQEAGIRYGGDGAFFVYLRKNKN